MQVSGMFSRTAEQAYRMYLQIFGGRGLTKTGVWSFKNPALTMTKF